jgi:hypothetical protein
VSPEIVLSYTDARWHAAGPSIELEHADLSSLERLLEERFSRTGVVSVAMRFDVSSLPAWMRQYHAHYFNYTLRWVARAVHRPPEADA